jgi:hypothetical protein
MKILEELQTTTFGGNLGASPAELDGDVESSRARSWHSHDGEAELKLWEDDDE